MKSPIFQMTNKRMVTRRRRERVLSHDNSEESPSPSIKIKAGKRFSARREEGASNVMDEGMGESITHGSKSERSFVNLLFLRENNPQINRGNSKRYERPIPWTERWVWALPSKKRNSDEKVRR